MKRLALVFLIACKSSTPTPPTTKPAQATDAALATRIETGLIPAVVVRGEDVRFSLEARMREYKINAVSVAVIDNYEVVWSKAYGLADAEAGTPATTQTTFLAGSISKSVNALGQLMAVADGLYTLDAPINDALESWKLPDNDLTRAKPVTLRMLLSHTGGTTVHGFRGYAPSEQVPTILQILDGKPPANSAPIRVDLAPGTKFRYSGGGTTITQLALGEKSKQPYPDVMAARVLGPLGMVDSSFDQVLSPARLAKAAVGYDAAGKQSDGKRFIYPEMAAAGLWTTPADLARFFAEVAKARAGKSKLVSQAIATQMTTKVTDVDEMNTDAVGLGVFLMNKNGAIYFGHGGSDIGFQADAMISLDGGHGVVIMTNSENGWRLFTEIERTVMAAYGWPGADAPVTRVALDAAQRAKLVGRYAADDAPLEILEKDGKLFGRVPFEGGAELVPTATDVLVNTDTGTELRLTAAGLEVRPRRGTPRSLVRSTSGHPLFLLEDGKPTEAVAALRATKNPKADEERINGLGYALLARDTKQAIAVFKLNVDAFPDSANAHDSLAEAYAKSGDKKSAIAEYERAALAVEKDPRIPVDAKATFKKRVEIEIAKLKQ